MFDKLFEAQQKAEEVKKRLDSISVFGETEGGKVRVVASASKEIREVAIDDEFLKQLEDKEELEELLVVALNKALQQADNVSQAEMAVVSQDLLGGIGGLGNIFGK